MNAEAYKHVLKVDRDAWFLRFYGWMWHTDPSKADVCKLFWGYLFAVPNLLLRFVWLLIWPLRVLLRQVDWEALNETQPKAKRDVPSRASEFFARSRPRRFAKFFGIGVLVGVALVLVAVVAWSISLFVPVAPEVGNAVLEWLVTPSASLAVVALVLLQIVVIGGSAWLNKRYDFSGRSERRKNEKRERGELTFGDMLVAGARAVKSNTCPRLDVVDEEKKP